MNTSTSVRTGPRTWKLWLLTVVGIYPVLVVLVAIITPATAGWPGPARLALVVPLAVASISWFIGPWQRRTFAGWLTR